MAYPGGKDGAGVWQRIVNQIPPHDVWISAFAGDCAVTRHIRPAAASVLIDLDAEVLRRWIPRRRPNTRLIQTDGIQWLRTVFGLEDLVGPPDPTTPAAAVYRGLVPLAAGVAGCGDGRPPVVCVYADPPYLRSTRGKDRVYRHELADNRHVELLHVLNRLPCYCLVHGYPSLVYDEILTGWRTWTFRAMTRGGIRIEQCWANYPEPTELHDYQCVGNNKRQRERIHRRCRAWSAALGRVGPLERGAILQALAEVAQRPKPPDPAPLQAAAGDECPGHGRGGTWPPCCDRVGQYNGFGSDGPLIFECPKHCSCHD